MAKASAAERELALQLKRELLLTEMVDAARRTAEKMHEDARSETKKTLK